MAHRGPKQQKPGTARAQITTASLTGQSLPSRSRFTQIRHWGCLDLHDCPLFAHSSDFGTLGVNANIVSSCLKSDTYNDFCSKTGRQPSCSPIRSGDTSVNKQRSTFVQCRRRLGGRVKIRKPGRQTARRDQQLFRHLIESSWHAVEVFDQNGQIIYAGGSTMRILGYGAEETIGKISFNFIHPDDQAIAAAVLQRALANPGHACPGTFRMLHKDGSWRTIEGRLLNQLDDPNVKGIVASYRDVTEALEATRRMKEALAQLDRLANTDGLTGVGTRRCFDLRLQEEWRRCARERVPLSLILIDVDHFKAFNDTYGHPAGDECLRQVAEALTGAVNRGGDVVARYGGEEFVCLLPGIDPGGAVQVAERMRVAVGAKAIPHSRSSVSDQVSITAGVASCIPDGNDAGSLLRAADTALYDGKKQGRNRCILMTEGLGDPALAAALLQRVEQSHSAVAM